MPLVIVITWVESGTRHDQAYGLWTPQDDLSHLDEIRDFVEGWERSTGNKSAAVTMYLVATPVLEST